MLLFLIIVKRKDIIPRGRGLDFFTVTGYTPLELLAPRNLGE